MRIRRTLMALAAAGLAATGLASSASAGTPGAKEHFLLLQTSVSASPIVVATGPIHARGTDTVLSATKDHFVFPHGTVTVIHHAAANQHFFDPVTCLERDFEQGTYKITHGTGAYADVEGSGTYQVSVTVVACSHDEPPDLFFLRVKASGPLTL